MPYPVTVIPFNQLLNAINTQWVTNGEGDITGVVGNNIENSLYQGIVYAPFNSQLAQIVTTTSSFQATHGITYFYSQVPSDVVFGDNFWNEWAFINSTSSDIPFGSGLGYFDLSFTFQNTIPAKALLRISKATNGLWIQTGTYGGTVSSIPIQKDYPEFIVGAMGSPMADGSNTLTITDSRIIPESALAEVEIHSDGSELGRIAADRLHYSVTPLNNPKRFLIIWDRGLSAGTLIQPKYPVSFSVAAPQNSIIETVYSATLNDAETATLVDTDGNIFTIPSGTQGELNITLSGNADNDGKISGNYLYFVNNDAGTITISYGGNTQIINTIDDAMFDNIVISADNGLGGVKIVATGIGGLIITLNAKFNYNSFSI